jgi:hypothetical protein
VEDVAKMPALYKVYRNRLKKEPNEGKKWFEKIEAETASRLQESMSDNYNPYGRDKSLAPLWK